MSNDTRRAVVFALATLHIFTSLGVLCAQQVADTAFRPPIEKPTYRAGTGPVVQIDEAHRNFHTSTGRYLPFAELLRRDGYVVKASGVRFTAESLRNGRVLVISNANREDDPNDSTDRSAFSADEIAVVRSWVAGGGSLLVKADQKPWAPAAEALGRAFGIGFLGGNVRKPDDATGRLVFRKSDGTLLDHPITNGITEVATFAGSSFEMDARGEPLLVFGSDAYLFSEQNDTSTIAVKGHLQGAVLRFGKGRVAVFGEAAMFTAQLSGPDYHPMGMNAAIAKQNPQFILNLMRWLTNAKEGPSRRRAMKRRQVAPDRRD
jgi:hypothetical protein